MNQNLKSPGLQTLSAADKCMRSTTRVENLTSLKLLCYVILLKRNFGGKKCYFEEIHSREISFQLSGSLIIYLLDTTSEVLEGTMWEFAGKLLAVPSEERSVEDMKKLLPWFRHRSTLFKNLEDGKCCRLKYKS